MAGGHACVAGIHEFWRNPPKVGDRCRAKPTPEGAVPAICGDGRHPLYEAIRLTAEDLPCCPRSMS